MKFSISEISLITFLTTIFFLISSLSIYKGFYVANFHQSAMDESDVNRNENSTPRSFILPATPAVTMEQERKKQDKLSDSEFNKCVSILASKGYVVDEIDFNYNAKLIENLLAYQNNLNLIRSGRLDPVTRKSLGC